MTNTILLILLWVVVVPVFLYISWGLLAATYRFLLTLYKFFEDDEFIVVEVTDTMSAMFGANTFHYYGIGPHKEINDIATKLQDVKDKINGNNQRSH